MEPERHEVARWFSKKVNIGNYENLDFGCSDKVECDEKDKEKVARDMELFCEKMVEHDVDVYNRKVEAIKNQRGRRFEKKEDALNTAKTDINDFG